MEIITQPLKREYAEKPKEARKTLLEIRRDYELTGKEPVFFLADPEPPLLKGQTLRSKLRPSEFTLKTLLAWLRAEETGFWLVDCGDDGIHRICDLSLQEDDDERFIVVHYDDMLSV